MSPPLVVRSGAELRALLWEQRKQGVVSGLVPTMGALHEGHLSLARAAGEACGFTVVTIFVNPTQFAAGEDLDKYPRTFADDCRMVGELGVDVVFAPSVEEMYPPGFSTFVEPPAAARRWEGEHRPTHFRGVATVVLKLFQLAPADIAYFGQKDYQQVQVIRRMIDDFNLPIRLDMRPIVREADGLAMSSRNRYLTEPQRRRALALHAALRGVAEAAGRGTCRVETLERGMRQQLAEAADAVDYAVIVDGQSLEPITTLRPPWVALIAARIGATRLIDNLHSDELNSHSSA